MDLSTSLKLTFAATDLRPPFIRRRKGLKLRFSPGKKTKPVISKGKTPRLFHRDHFEGTADAFRET